MRLAYSICTEPVMRSLAVRNGSTPGLHSYGITGKPQGHYYVDPALRVSKSQNAYERPQPHACFILSVSDDLVNDGGISWIFGFVKHAFQIWFRCWHQLFTDPR